MSGLIGWSLTQLCDDEEDDVDPVLHLMVEVVEDNTPHAEPSCGAAVPMTDYVHVAGFPLDTYEVCPECLRTAERESFPTGIEEVEEKRAAKGGRRRAPAARSRTRERPRYLVLIAEAYLAAPEHSAAESLLEEALHASCEEAGMRRGDADALVQEAVDRRHKEMERDG